MVCSESRLELSPAWCGMSGPIAGGAAIPLLSQDVWLTVLPAPERPAESRSWGPRAAGPPVAPRHCLLLPESGVRHSAHPIVRALFCGASASQLPAPRRACELAVLAWLAPNEAPQDGRTMRLLDQGCFPNWPRSTQLGGGQPQGIPPGRSRVGTEPRGRQRRPRRGAGPNA